MRFFIVHGSGMNDDENLERALRTEVQHALETLKTSPTELSRASGLGKNYVNRWLAGEFSPTLRRVQEIRAGIKNLQDRGNEAATE